MKTKYFRFLTTFLFLLFLGLTGTKAQSLQRSIKKEWPLNAQGTLAINNSFGNIEVNTWDKPQVMIEINIQVEGDSNREKAFFDGIQIDFTQSDSKITAKTSYPSKKSNWNILNLFSGGNNFNYRVDFTIRMPKTAQADMTNEFGNIAMDVLDGKATLDCSFGNLTLEELNHSNNSISLDYSSDSEIGYMAGGTISADYSNLSVERSNELKLNADYGKTRLGQIEQLDFNLDYGSLSLESTQQIEGDADYLTLKIGEVAQSAKLSTDYGSIKIDHILGSTESVIIDGDYTTIRLKADKDWEFAFEIATEYASLKTDFPLTYQRKESDITEHYYQGIHLSDKNSLSISADYGSIRLYQK